MSTWVLCLQVMETEDGIKLLAPNEYVREKVESNYACRIREIAVSLAETEGSVSYTHLTLPTKA